MQDKGSTMTTTTTAWRPAVTNHAPSVSLSLSLLSTRADRPARSLADLSDLRQRLERVQQRLTHARAASLAVEALY